MPVAQSTAAKRVLLEHLNAGPVISPTVTAA
jgi:hypothetical protein